MLYPALTGSNPAYLPFAMAALAIVLYTILHPSVRARRREEVPTEPVDPADPAGSPVEHSEV